MFLIYKNGKKNVPPAHRISYHPSNRLAKEKMHMLGKKNRTNTGGFAFPQPGGGGGGKEKNAYLLQLYKPLSGLQQQRQR